MLTVGMPPVEPSCRSGVAAVASWPTQDPLQVKGHSWTDIATALL